MSPVPPAPRRPSTEPPKSSPERAFRRTRLPTLAATVLLLPTLVAVTVMPVGMIVGIIMVFVFLPGSVVGAVLTYGAALIPLVVIATVARYALKRSGWRRPMGIVLVLYVALALPLLPVKAMVLLSEAHVLRTPEPVSMHSEDPSWFLWAHLLVGAVLIVLVAVECLAVVRARRVGEGDGGASEPTGSGWGGIGAAVVALSVVAVPMSVLAYEGAARETAAHVAADVATIGEREDPLAVLDHPTWDPWWVKTRDGDDRVEVHYRRKPEAILEVHTVPLDSDVVACWEESEESDCVVMGVRVPGLGEGELRAATDLHTASTPTDTSTVVYLEIAGSDLMVMLLPGIDQSKSFLQGRVPYDISAEELLDAAEGLYLMDQGDTEAVHRLALDAHLAW
ncbi:hypothetical protein [Nocardiopsis sp. NPDC006832]|uniref:hypothetical protein n=1 Tax=Nocardiopsis sp. NPDC006832 TaxID=3157188 RepID=UPI003401D445